MAPEITADAPVSPPPDPHREAGRAATEERIWRRMNGLWFSTRPKVMALCREFDLFPPQIMTLSLLGEPKPMREVARAMACDSSNLTGITDRLEDRGLLKRTVAPHDRRVKLLVLTEEGRRIRDLLDERINRPPEQIQRLDDEELATLEALLAKLELDSPTT